MPLSFYKQSLLSLIFFLESLFFPFHLQHLFHSLPDCHNHPFVILPYKEICNALITDLTPYPMLINLCWPFSPHKVSRFNLWCLKLWPSIHWPKVHIPCTIYKVPGLSYYRWCLWRGRNRLTIMSILLFLVKVFFWIR